MGRSLPGLHVDDLREPVGLGDRGGDGAVPDDLEFPVDLLPHPGLDPRVALEPDGLVGYQEGVVDVGRGFDDVLPGAGVGLLDGELGAEEDLGFVYPALGGYGEHAVAEEASGACELVTLIELLLAQELLGGVGEDLDIPAFVDDAALSADPLSPAEALDPDASIPHHR